MYIEKLYEILKPTILSSIINTGYTDEDIQHIIKEWGESANTLLAFDDDMKDAFLTQYSFTGDLIISLNFALEYTIFKRYGMALKNNGDLLIYKCSVDVINEFINCDSYDVDDLSTISTIPARLIQVECQKYDLLLYFHYADINEREYLKLITFYIPKEGDYRCFNYDIGIRDFKERLEKIDPVVDTPGRFLRISTLLLLTFGVNYKDINNKRRLL